MVLLTWLLFFSSQIETTNATDFARDLQIRALSATVRIQNLSQKNEGSGVIVGRQGSLVYILTTHHVVKDADKLVIAVFSEKSYPRAENTYRSARVVAKLPDTKDLALIRLVTEDKMPGVLPLCPQSEIPRGEDLPVLAVGCTRGQAPTALASKVASRKKVRHKEGGEPAIFWELPGTIALGRSGGPLIDKRGYLLGICSGTSDGKGYFCHAEEIHRFLRQNGFQWLGEKEVEPK